MMGLFSSSHPVCPVDLHCSQWARKHMKYCLCGTRDGVSLVLGLISVLSWGVAEIPQIITSYKEKSAEGLSIAFLMTWIVGDLLNLFGCMLEPATLPTQYYMAMLYTVTTTILTTQTIFYGHIYHRIKSNTRCQKGTVEKERPCNYSGDKKQVDDEDGGSTTSIPVISGVIPSSPIPLPASAHNGSLERESYYMSARSLTRNHTPTLGFCRVERRSTSVHEHRSIEEPLLGGQIITQSAPPSNIKPMLCVVFAMTFLLSSCNLQLEKISRANTLSTPGVVMPMGRKLLKVGDSLMEGTGTENIGTFLGWGMAAIYMGGRLPQICLNIRRGHVQGLNPFMFVFALIGNATYVASILVNSMDWTKLRPNLPWLVDAGGCVLLDTFIIIQFIYFRSKTRQNLEEKAGTLAVS